MPTYDHVNDSIHGTCLCGTIAYHAQGPLYATSHCFCSQCQRQHGIAGSYGNVSAASFVITRGADLVTEYVKSPKGRCGFCSTCGSLLFWRGTDTPERVAVTLGTLEPAWTGHVEREWFAEQKQTWLPPAP